MTAVGDELDIRYARNGGVAIAYQVVGDGDVDLVYVPDYVSNLVYGWQSPYYREFYERLARPFRLILFDKRGTGLSDQGPHFAALETRMEDLRAVLDDVGSERAVVLASHEGCAMASLYAATYPERTRALILFHPAAEFEGAEAELQRELAELRERWGTREYCDELLRSVSPTLYAREEDREWFANWLRVSASPAVAYALNRAFAETDLGEVLPAVRAATLVLYRRGTFNQEAASQAVAAKIPGARTMHISGSDYAELFLSPEVPDEIERFVAGEEPPSIPTSVLTTVMFTDLVGSTERATALGDSAWRDLLAAHHSVVRRELARFRGEEQDTAGDGFFATFDGPARGIRAADAIRDGVRELGLDVRIGIHVGECELHDGKPSGLAVNVGARIAAAAGAGEVFVSQTVKDLVAGTGIAFADRGERELKGVPGTWRLYAAAEASGGMRSQ
jgi:class 3 adenylate cyclase